MEYSIDEVNWTTLTLDASGTSYTVRGLTNGTAYTFRMAAITSAGLGAWGTFTTATPARVPLSPLNIVVTGQDKKATLTWAAPSSNGGSAITGYAIYRNNVLLTTVSAATLTYLDTNGVTGLTNGTSYYWSVRAVNAIGESVSSNVFGTPFAQVGTPTNVLAVRGNRQVTVSWTAPTNNSGFTLTGYQVERSVNGSTWVVDSLVTTSPVTITNLTNGVIHYFRVTAYVNGGPSASPGGLGVVSAAASATPMTAATAPTSFTAASGNGSVALSWSAPQDPGGAPVSAYQISQCLVVPAGAQCNVAGQYSTIVTSTN
jgi:titin